MCRYWQLACTRGLVEGGLDEYHHQADTHSDSQKGEKSMSTLDHSYHDSTEPSTAIPLPPSRIVSNSEGAL
jgi:hypothetical protein